MHLTREVTQIREGFLLTQNIAVTAVYNNNVQNPVSYKDCDVLIGDF